MKIHGFSCLILILLLVSTAGNLSGQGYGEEACVITFKGENRNRTVDGPLDQECGHYTGEILHSAPFGNWGVTSNYGHKNNWDQFRGWKDEGGGPRKLHWNSCTLYYPAPDCDYYERPGCTSPQESSDTVMHGQFKYRATVTECPSDPGTPSIGCSLQELRVRLWMP